MVSLRDISGGFLGLSSHACFFNCTVRHQSCTHCSYPVVTTKNVSRLRARCGSDLGRVFPWSSPDPTVIPVTLDEPPSQRKWPSQRMCPSQRKCPWLMVHSTPKAEERKGKRETMWDVTDCHSGNVNVCIFRRRLKTASKGQQGDLFIGGGRQREKW